MSNTQKSQVGRKIATAADYQKVFSTLQGQRVLSDLVYRHLVAPRFHPDPYINAHKSGQEDTVKEILNILKLDIGSIRQRMLEEDSDASETIFDIGRK